MLLEVMHYLYVVVFGTILVKMAPSAWRLARLRPYSLDPAWAVVWCLVINRFWDLAGDLYFGEVLEPAPAYWFRIIWLWCAILVGVTILISRHAYGRGSRDV